MSLVNIVILGKFDERFMNFVKLVNLNNVVNFVNLVNLKNVVNFVKLVNLDILETNL